MPTYRTLEGSSVLDVLVRALGRRYLPDDRRCSDRRGGGDCDQGNVVWPWRRRTPVGFRFPWFRLARTTVRLSEHPDERHRTGLLVAARPTRRIDDPRGYRCPVGGRHAAQSARMVVAHEKRHAGAADERCQEIRQRDRCPGLRSASHGNLLERDGHLSTFVRVH